MKVVPASGDDGGDDDACARLESSQVGRSAIRSCFQAPMLGWVGAISNPPGCTNPRSSRHESEPSLSLIDAYWSLCNYAVINSGSPNDPHAAGKPDGHSSAHLNLMVQAQIVVASG